MNNNKENRVRKINKAKLEYTKEVDRRVEDAVNKETRKVYIVAVIMIIASVTSLCLLGE